MSQTEKISMTDADFQSALKDTAKFTIAGLCESLANGKVWPEICEALASSGLEIKPRDVFQERVAPWMDECFGPMIAGDKEERNHRFLEEALELIQACGSTRSEAHQLVDYVYDRPVGDPPQEVGGVMVTLAALCLAQGMDMHECGEVELARVWTKVEQIRAKQAAKPQFSPLPETFLPEDDPEIQQAIEKIADAHTEQVTEYDPDDYSGLGGI